MLQIGSCINSLSCLLGFGSLCQLFHLSILCLVPLVKLSKELNFHYP